MGKVFSHKSFAMEIKSFVVASLLFCAVFAAPAPATKEQIEFLQRNLPGEWKEDQYQRDNLSNFLSEAGLNWVKRIYATTTSWESTQSVVDLGSDLGGVTDAIAEIKGNSLITYLTKKGEDSVYMHAIRTIKEDSPDVMIYETKIFPSEVSMKATYHRQPKQDEA